VRYVHSSQEKEKKKNKKKGLWKILQTWMLEYNMAAKETKELGISQDL